MKKLLFSLLAACVAFSCTTDTESALKSDDTTSLSVNVAVASPDSRVDFADNGDGSWAVTWNADDALGGWSTESGDTYQSKFTISSYHAEESEFTGNLVYSTVEMRFVHPYNYSALSKSENSVAIDLSAQSVASDFSKLSANTYMVSNAFDVESVSSTTSHAEGAISMTHLGCAITLNVKLVESTGYTLSSVAIGESVPTVATLDMGTGEAEVTSTGTVTLSASDVAFVDGVASINYNSFPFTLDANEAISIVATVVDDAGAYYTASASVSSEGAMEFARATVNTINVTLGDLTPSDDSVSIPTITFDSTSGFPTAVYADDTTFTFADGAVTMIASGFYYSSYYGNFTLSNECHIFNLTELENFTQIVINEDGNYYNYTVYAGTEVKPMETKLSYTKTGDDYVYDIPSDCKFFTIYNESGYGAYATSMDFYYDGVGATVEAPVEEEVVLGGTAVNIAVDDFLPEGVVLTENSSTSDTASYCELTGDYTFSPITFNFATTGTTARIWRSSAVNELRIYNNSTVTVSTSTGTIKYIVFENSVSTFAFDSGVIDGKIWTGDAASVVITVSGTTKPGAMTVYYE